MKILIFGARGMLGHRLMLQLSKYHEVYGTVRNGNFILPSIDSDHIIPMIHCYLWGCLREAFEKVKPDVVINCIAAIPQRNHTPEEMIMANAVFPHRLAEFCTSYHARLIHFSTDAVFSGKRGNYTEDDEPDGNDTYALTKRLGEISDQSHVLTLRCCPIGRELNGAHSLVEWFLAQTGEVKAYTKAYFSPRSTHEIARIINEYVLPRPYLHGVYHLGGAQVSKFMLLYYLNLYFGRENNLIQDETLVINRTLNAARFWKETDYGGAEIMGMVEEIAADNALYEGVHA